MQMNVKYMYINRHNHYLHVYATCFLPGPFSSVDAFANPAGLLTQTNSKTSHLLVDLSGEEVMQGTRFGMYTLNILVKGESESC